MKLMYTITQTILMTHTHKAPHKDWRIPCLMPLKSHNGKKEKKKTL